MVDTVKSRRIRYFHRQQDQGLLDVMIGKTTSRLMDIMIDIATSRRIGYYDRDSNIMYYWKIR